MKKLKNVPVTSRGQWDYPGRDTIIPSGDITMKGVPYPVLGTDNTGHSIMMMPGGEYTFPGDMVYEKPVMKNGGYIVTRSNDRKGKTHKVTGPDGTVKYFGDSKLGQHPKDPERKKAFYARHKKNLENNPYFRAFARKTWEKGGETSDDKEMLEGVADILSRVKDKKNREELAKYMMSNFQDENVSFNPTDFLHDAQVFKQGGEMIRRADGSYSQRGLWDNIRANKGSGKKPTKEMLEQERKIRKEEKAFGGVTGWMDNYQDGGEKKYDKSFWDRYKWQKSETDPAKYEQVNLDAERYAFNSKLKGDPEVQKYQKWINDNYNAYLDEDGIWGKDTQIAVDKFVGNQEKPVTSTIDPETFKNTQGGFQFRIDEKGRVQAKTENKYEDGFQDWQNMEKLNPTLSEFKNLLSRIPKYNEYYEDTHDADPKQRGVQAGPVTAERSEEIKDTKQYKPLDEKYKENLGKTFGGLPVVEGPGIYEGYSPNRIWTSAPSEKSRPWLGDSEAYNPETNPRYLYFIAPKHNTQWGQDEKVAEQLKDLHCASGNCGDEYYTTPKNKQTSAAAPNFSPAAFEFKKRSEEVQKKAEKVIPSPTGETWRLGQQMLVEMRNNPEIVAYAKEHNIDLDNLGKDQFSPVLAEALVASRDARFNKKGLVIPHSREYTPVIQNPEEFTLAGYLPVTMDMFSPTMKSGSEQNTLLNWDEKTRQEYLQRAGVPPEMWDKVYMHTSPFSIRDYVPGKKMGGSTGWLNNFQDGGPARPADLPPMPENAGSVNQWLYDKGVQRQKRLQSEYDVRAAADKELKYARSADYADLLAVEFYGPNTTYDELTDGEKIKIDDILNQRRENLGNINLVTADLSAKGIKAGYDPNFHTMFVPSTPVERGVHSHEFSHVGDQAPFGDNPNPGVGPYFTEQLGKNAMSRDSQEFLGQPSSLKKDMTVGENIETDFNEADYLLDPSEAKARLRALRDSSIEQGYKLQAPGYDIEQYKKGFTPEEMKQYEQLKKAGLSDSEINEMMYLFAKNDSPNQDYAKFGGQSQGWLNKYN
jgi:hypothetical protein